MLQRSEIKKGLLNVKQSQLELLNELKEEHHFLKKYSPPSSIIEVDETEIHELQQVRQLTAQVTLLNKENRMLNEDYQKMKKNYFGEKQKAREWELWNDISSRLQFSVVRDILEGVSLMDVRMMIEGEMRGYSCELINAKNTFKDMLPLLANAEAKKGYSNSNSHSNGNIQRDTRGDSRVQELKQQISSLMHMNITNAQRADQRLEKVISQLQEKDNELADRIGEYNTLNQKYIGLQVVYHGLLNQHLQADQRASQRIEHKVDQKTIQLSTQVQSLNKKCQEQSKELIEKEAVIRAHQETLTTLRKVNQELLHQLTEMQKNAQKSEQQVKSVEVKMEAKMAKIQKERAFVVQQKDKTISLQTLELESLRDHVEELKKSVVAVGKDGGRQLRSKDTQLRKVLKLNAMVGHLWKVKEVQFQNLQDILQLTHN